MTTITMNNLQIQAIESMTAALAQMPKGILHNGRRQRYEAAIEMTKQFANFIFLPVFHRKARDLRKSVNHYDVLINHGIEFTCHNVNGEEVRYTEQGTLSECMRISIGALTSGSTAYVDNEGSLRDLNDTIQAKDLFSGEKKDFFSRPIRKGMSSQKSASVDSMERDLKSRTITAADRLTLEAAIKLSNETDRDTIVFPNTSINRKNLKAFPGFGKIIKTMAEGEVLRTFKIENHIAKTLMADCFDTRICYGEAKEGFDGYITSEGVIVMN